MRPDGFEYGSKMGGKFAILEGNKVGVQPVMILAQLNKEKHDVVRVVNKEQNREVLGSKNVVDKAFQGIFNGIIQKKKPLDGWIKELSQSVELVEAVQSIIGELDQVQPNRALIEDDISDEEEAMNIVIDDDTMELYTVDKPVNEAQWDTVGNSICSFVRRVLSGCPLDSKVDRTLLVLLPNIVGPKRINQFRPINLCNVLYKIVTKTIVNRLTPMLVKFVK
ncbi:RNA-directed DNA polymerase [Gossypium australe]|uniref:RNA-directed DNA polymerase n=1 Tax=Gossypium australe TaxID=47621 RepID=A0A5B6W077_9ROSI|nr:RNA-directed DNA polymerase [Gossypium australe]